MLNLVSFLSIKNVKKLNVKGAASDLEMIVDLLGSTNYMTTLETPRPKMTPSQAQTPSLSTTPRACPRFALCPQAVWVKSILAENAMVDLAMHNRCASGPNVPSKMIRRRPLEMFIHPGSPTRRRGASRAHELDKK